MPSVAGSIIVLWISSIDITGIREVILLPEAGEGLSTASLVLLFLYGNLFCYVSSYPILGFHATRVLDFDRNSIRASPLTDAYCWSIAIGLASFLFAWGAHPGRSTVPCFLLVGTFALFQVFRLLVVMRLKTSTADGNENFSSEAYDFGERLARTRVRKSFYSLNAQDWRTDYIDTYRHLREHGNSAFIFFLELVLASLIYSIAASSDSEFQDLFPDIGVLLAIWCMPAVLVHWSGQQLESEFSNSKG
jgi:hypothetical protein